MDLRAEERDGESPACAATPCGRPMKAGPQSEGLSIIATAWGSELSTASDG